MFRSQDMSLNRLYFAKESMWDTMNHLAKTNKAMLTPPSTEFQPPINSLSVYSAQMAKITEELFHYTDYIEEKMREFEWPVSVHTKTPLEYINELDKYCETNRIEGHKLFEEVEEQLRNKHELLTSHVTNFESILEQRGTLLEELSAYSILGSIVPSEILNMSNQRMDSQEEINLNSRRSGRKKFNSILGLIPTEYLMKLQKLLFRISRENIVMKTKSLPEIVDDLVPKDKLKQKTLVFVLFPKSEKQTIVSKINSTLKYYEFTPLTILSHDDNIEMNIQLNSDLEDNEKVLLKTKEEINELLREFSRPRIIHQLSFIQAIKLIVKREQKFAVNLTYIEEKEGFYQLLLWVPVSFIDKLHEELAAIKMSDPTFTKPSLTELGPDTPEMKNLTIPTYFKLNNFTRPFQLIINTYGVPSYKEVNPGLFTIITFPFLNGVMFGDIGHGLLLTLMGVYLCVFMNDKNSTLNQIKYLILFMGIFSFHAGWIYNEFFAVPFLTQDSCYYVNKLDNGAFKRRSPTCTYAYGIDWIWHQSGNETGFINSFKMKFSIIVGVLQMMFGIMLKGLNGIYFKRWADLWFEAIPQLVFMAVTFGYMSFCIIAKWLQNWEGKDPVSIIQLFINFISVDEPLYGSASYQQIVQMIFTALAFIMMFVMLIPKPLILHKQQQKKRMARMITGINHEDSDESPNLVSKSNISDDSIDDEHDESLGELFVHQMIETIEFVLGSISNTASYLRLWALSLAHTQLSRVFLEMIFKFTVEDSSNWIVSFMIIIIGFVFFFFVTAAVIMLMSAMECFLHALRLHWVEFQNKFYKGEGKAFKPFTHSFHGDEDDDE